MTKEPPHPYNSGVKLDSTPMNDNPHPPPSQISGLNYRGREQKQYSFLNSDWFHELFIFQNFSQNFLFK